MLDIAGVAQRISPDEDGLGVLQHLKSHNPTQIIVAFSGQSFDLSKQDFFRLADDTMPKPVTALKCMQVLDGLIESKMTVRHLWDSVVTLMRAEGVPNRNINKIEAQMIQAMRAGIRPNMAQLVSEVVVRSELAVKVIEVLTKIGGLCGL